MKLERLEQLKDKIRAIPQQIRAPISAALAQSAEEITQFQRAAVPSDKGTLRSTIQWQFGGAAVGGKKGAILEDLMVVITAGGPPTEQHEKTGNYNYAAAQEFGTKKMPANPFFFPGFRLGKKRAKSRIARAANKALKGMKK